MAAEQAETAPPYEQRFDTEATDQELGRELYVLCTSRDTPLSKETGTYFPKEVYTNGAGERVIRLARHEEGGLAIRIQRGDSPPPVVQHPVVKLRLSNEGEVTDYETRGYPEGSEPEPLAIVQMLIDELPNAQPVSWR